MNCINHKSKEYKNLKNKSGLSDIQLRSAILKYQKNNNTSEFPTLNEIGDYVKWSSVFKKTDIETITKAATWLDQQFDIANIELEYNGEDAPKGTISVKDGIVNVGINLSNATLDVPFHEVLAHPIIRYLKQSNEKAYNNLLHELESPIGKKILNRLIEKSVDTGDVPYDEEAVVTMFGVYLQNAYFRKQLSKESSNFFNNIFQMIKDFISNLFRLNDVNLDTLPENVTLRDISEKLVSGRKLIYERQIDVSGAAHDLSSDENKYKSVFDEQNSKITFNSSGHKYINNLTNKEYVPVSDVGKIKGYNTDYTGPLTERATLASPVGTGIHAVFYEMATGFKKSESEYFPMTKHAFADIKMIYEGLLPKGAKFIASEQIISDDAANVAGTLDGLIQESDGTITLLDFKSKITKAPFLPENAKNKWLSFNEVFTTKKSEKVGKSERNRFDFQQTSYKTMLNKVGLKVDRKGLIPLEVSVIEDSKSPTGYSIDRVTITKALKNIQNEKDGIKGFYQLYDDYKVIKDVNSVFNITDDVDSIELKELNKLQDICNDALDVLKKRSVRYSILGKETASTMLARNIKVLESLSNTQAVLGIVQAAIKELKPIIKSYNNLMEEEKRSGSANWNLDTLESWHTYAESFSMLDEIKMFIQEYPKLLSSVESFSIDDLERLTDEAISYRNTIMSALDNKGFDSWKQWISSYSETVDAKWKLKAEIEFKKKWIENEPGFRETWSVDGKDVDKKSSITIDTYVQNYIADYMTRYDSLIQTEKSDFIKNNSDICLQDANGFFKYTTSVFDTKDPIVGAMVRGYYENMIDYRQTWVGYYKEMIDLINEFEKKHTKSSFADNKKLYDYMLEYTPDGARLVTEKPAKFESDFQTIRKEAHTNESLDQNQRFEYIDNWLNKNAPIVDQEGLNQSIREYYDKLLANDVITKDEYDILISNEFGEKKIDLKRLAYQDDIRMDLIDDIIRDRSEIVWQYRKIDSNKYPNTKYDNIMKLPQNNIDRKLYEYFVKVSKRGDSGVANRFKLNYYLPGVSKSFAERIVSGENVFKSAKKELSHSVFNLRPDDVGYGQYEFASEGNLPVDFVPVYFTNRLTDEEQSYDLPSIYKEWLKSSLNYEMTTNLLPLLQYTKRIINKRKVVKRNKSGQPIQNILGRRWAEQNSDSTVVDNYVESTTNHIADTVNAWFNQVIYDKSDNLDVTTSKIVKLFGQFTSLKVMGLNLYSMINNYAVAELNQALEVKAHSIMSPASYTRASFEYMKDIPNTLGDIGSRAPTGKTNLLAEHFGIFHEYGEGKVRDRSISKRLFYQSTLYVTTNLGEHMAQCRFLVGALIDKRANSKEDGTGEDLGTIYDNYTVENGELVLNHKVKNFGKAEQMKLRRQLNSLLRAMHGNYAQYSKVALQQNGFGALLLQFRKWIMPGMHRRWRNMYYDEFASSWKEGYYISGGKYYIANAKQSFWNVAKFFNKLGEESAMMDLAVKSNYHMLSKTQQEGIKKLNAEIGVFFSAWLIIMAIGWLDDDDKDKKVVSKLHTGKKDDDMSKFILNQFLYQVYRMQTEQTFYINPIDFIKIIKSPVAATSSLTDVAKLINQLYPWNITETYRSGRNKDRNKAMMMILKQSPVIRQYLRWLDPESQKKALDLTL